MGITKKGILGAFSGKVGTVVGYELRGQSIMRAMPKKRTSKASDKELANRKKFADMQSWLRVITPFLRVGFHNYAPTYEGFVAAKSYNSKNAIVGTFPNFVIDPALVRVSFGKLPQATEAAAVCEEPQKIKFTWSGGADALDERCMIMVYDTVNGRAIYDTAGPKRSRNTATLELSKHFSGKKVHIYLAFVTEDRKNQSMSQYLGEIEVL